MKRMFKVTIDMPASVPDQDIVEHIRTAVGHWGGSYHPDDPFFGLGRENVEVSTIKQSSQSGLQTCAACQGSGIDPDTDGPCRSCGGEGVI